jgi:hypothetical protein
MNLEILIDKLKINLFAETLMISSAWGFFDSFIDLKLEAIDIPILLISIYNSFEAYRNVRRQNDRYTKLMDYIERNGYYERPFVQYMDHPCGRLAVKTVLDRTELHYMYPGLAEKYPITSIC